MTRRLLVFTLALASVAPFAAVGAVAAGGAMQAPTGDRGWRTVAAGGRTCVEDQTGADRNCLPQNIGQITDLRETEQGWVAAGQLPAANGRDVVLFRSTSKDIERLASLPEASVPRGRPRLATDGTRLLGMVWLEGASQAELEVRAAEWLGRDWGPVVTVSPVGPGSQVAPTVTVLDDGRWLLLWTAFDGQDDETLWSLYDGGLWSAPAAVHENNTTPDIVPTVLATRRGAIAAWSWLDGRDYRLRTAFFDGSSWRLDPPTGGRGAVDARLIATAGSYLLTLQTVVPEEWVTYELDAEGRQLRRAAIPNSSNERPTIHLEESGISFRWLGGELPRELLAPWETAR